MRQYRKPSLRRPARQVAPVERRTVTWRATPPASAGLFPSGPWRIRITSLRNARSARQAPRGIKRLRAPARKGFWNAADRLRGRCPAGPSSRPRSRARSGPRARSSTLLAASTSRNPQRGRSRRTAELQGSWLRGSFKPGQELRRARLYEAMDGFAAESREEGRRGPALSVGSRLRSAVTR